MKSAIGPLARFDGAAVWSTLSAEQQAEIGALALEVVAGSYVDERMFEDGAALDHRVRQVAFQYGGAWPAERELREIFVETVARDALDGPDGSPRIPSTVGPISGVPG